jgi:hypothetical protein
MGLVAGFSPLTRPNYRPGHPADLAGQGSWPVTYRGSSFIMNGQLGDKKATRINMKLHPTIPSGRAWG